MKSLCCIVVLVLPLLPHASASTNNGPNPDDDSSVTRNTLSVADVTSAGLLEALRTEGGNTIPKTGSFGTTILQSDHSRAAVKSPSFHLKFREEDSGDNSARNNFHSSSKTREAAHMHLQSDGDDNLLDNSFKKKNIFLTDQTGILNKDNTQVKGDSQTGLPDQTPLGVSSSNTIDPNRSDDQTASGTTQLRVPMTTGPSQTASGTTQLRVPMTTGPSQTTSSTTQLRVPMTTVPSQTTSSTTQLRVPMTTGPSQTTSSTTQLRVPMTTGPSQTASGTTQLRVPMTTGPSQTAGGTTQLRVPMTTGLSQTTSGTTQLRVPMTTGPSQTASSTTQLRVTMTTVPSQTTSGTTQLRVPMTTVPSQTTSGTTQLRVTMTTVPSQTASVAGLHAVCEHSCCKVSVKATICSGCQLRCVPTDLPRTIVTLLLDNNGISSDALFPGIFSNYSELEELNLDSNNITILPEGVLDGLSSLRTLSLYNNSIKLNEALNNSTVFFPVGNTLETLIIHRNTHNRKKDIYLYPDKAFSVLSNLSLLHIDGLRVTSFGVGFYNLTKLTKLSMSGVGHRGYCYMISIDGSTFRYLTYLISLDISGCNLKGPQVRPEAFAPLSSLQVLNVSDNIDLGIKAVGELMYGLQNNSHFVHLSMARIVPRFAPCVIIYKDTLRYFNKSTLEVIEAMDNEIEMIEYGALELLPKTLKKVNLTNNRIMYGSYWKNMASLRHLQVLNIDGLLKAETFPTFFPSSRWRCIEPNQTIVLHGEQGSEHKCICGDETCSQNSDVILLPLPPELKKFTMHSNSLAYMIGRIKFCANNKLTSADLSYNVFQELQGPITGLDHMKDLNLTSCFIETISDRFFDNLTSLENLNLYLNLLGDRLNNDTGGKIFDSLTQLKQLNLSFNNLYRLNSVAFKDLSDLEVLDLSTNRLSHINFSVRHMTKLRFLDIHKNDISSLPEELMNLVSSLLSRNSTVKIDMSANPISCDCQNLPFLEWVIKTQVFGINYTYYYCKYSSTSRIATEMKNGYEEEVARLRKACSTHVVLFLAVAGGTFLLVVFILGLLFYRFRWTLRYWFHAAKLKIYANRQQVVQQYEYDVFISYASEDVNFILNELSQELSTKRRLSLMIHGETFQAGRHIADNIYMAVRQCRKTLVLVTRNMLTSHWCTYELQMARQESISTGRDVLVFLFLEELPASSISVDVMSYVKTSTYVMYPEQASHREAFWNKLADDLRAE